MLVPIALSVLAPASLSLQSPIELRPNTRLFPVAADESPTFDLGANWFVFLRPESAEGPAGTDLNGDGDTDDSVLVTYQFRTDLLLPTRLAGTDVKLGDNIVALATDEAAILSDVNGDGDTDDGLLATYNLVTGGRDYFVAPVVEIEDAAGSLVVFRTDENGVSRLYMYSSLTQLAVELPATSVSRLAPEGALYRAQESLAGVDLNGDGDQNDTVTQFMKADQQTTYMPTISVGIHVWQGGRYIIDTFRESVAGIDYNNDGDDHDVMVQTLDVVTGAEAILGIARLTGGGSGRGYTAMFKSETIGGDLNGDGDAIDNVLVMFDHATGATLSSSLLQESMSATVSLNERGRPSALVFVYEQTVDLNGNGVLGETVPHYWDLVANSVTNTRGLASDPSRSAAGTDRALWTTLESDIGSDVTGDGMVTMDPVLVRYMAGGQPEYIGAYPGRVENPTAGLQRGMFFHVAEATQGRDLNGDGDTADQILHLLGPMSRRAFSLGHGASELILGERIFAGFLREDIEQRDLNMDGDLDDRIPFVGRL